jgi:hypothetical protein
MTIYLVGGSGRLYTYRVHVRDTDPRDDDELDVTIDRLDDVKALSEARRQADLLYDDYSLTLVSVI